MTTIKQVIVVRKDLNMRKGKCVAQGAHASVSVLIQHLSRQNAQPNKHERDMFNGWLESGQTKICVGVNSEKELMDAYTSARDAGIPCSIITDSGKTEFGGVATKTAAAIGPEFAEKIDRITGTLKLL